MIDVSVYSLLHRCVCLLMVVGGLKKCAIPIQQPPLQTLFLKKVLDFDENYPSLEEILSGI